MCAIDSGVDDVDVSVVVQRYYVCAAYCSVEGPRMFGLGCVQSVAGVESCCGFCVDVLCDVDDGEVILFEGERGGFFVDDSADGVCDLGAVCVFDVVADGSC